MKLEGCHALITGASAGIGRELALQLAKRGAKSLVLVARRVERLETLRAELQLINPQVSVLTHQSDLAEKSQLLALSQWLATQKVAIDLLINNAGLGDIGYFATGDPERIDRIIQVNIRALTLLTQEMLPRMIAQKRGAILNVSSSASFLPMAGLAVYAASKAFVTSFSEALRVELRGTGITVTALCPGPVHTEFTQVARRANCSSAPSPEFAHIAIERVARAGLAGIENDTPLVIPGTIIRLAMLLVRCLPRPILRLASTFTARRAFDRIEVTSSI